MSSNQPGKTYSYGSRNNHVSSQNLSSSRPSASSSRVYHDNTQNPPSPLPSCSRKRRRRESVSSTESHDDYLERSSPPPRENRRRQRRELEPAEEDAIEGFLSMMRGQIRVCVHPDDHIKFFQRNLSLLAEFKKTTLGMTEEQLPETPEISRHFTDSTQPILYLGLEADGKPLGRLKIRISCGPRRREQMLRLCNLYKGLCFGQAHNVGENGEVVSFGNLEKVNPKGEQKATDNHNIKDLEDEKIEKYEKRNVTIEAGTTRLTICTRTSSQPGRGIKIGYVDHGLELLRGALKKYSTIQLDETGRATHYDASRIRIAETGVFYDKFTGFPPFSTF